MRLPQNARSLACRSARCWSLASWSPAQKLFDARRRIGAEVRADGTLAHAGSQASIHRLGALVQGKPACNGWTFWHFEAEGKLKPIDLLRDEAKRQLGLGRGSAIAPAE